MNIQSLSEGNEFFKVTYEGGDSLYLGKAQIDSDERFEEIKALIDSGEYQPFVPMSPEEIEKLSNEKRVFEIDKRLVEIDLESVRPLRAIQNATQKTADTDKLSELDTEAAQLRAERAGLV